MFAIRRKFISVWLDVGLWVWRLEVCVFVVILDCCVFSCCKQPILLGDSLFKASNCPVGQNKCNLVAWKICSFTVLPLELRICSLLLQYLQLRKCLQLPSLYGHVSNIFCPSVLATLSPLALRCREVESDRQLFARGLATSVLSHSRQPRRSAHRGSYGSPEAAAKFPSCSRKFSANVFLFTHGRYGGLTVAFLVRRYDFVSASDFDC